MTHIESNVSRRIQEAQVQDSRRATMRWCMTRAMLYLVAACMTFLASGASAQSNTLTPEAARDLRLQPGVGVILVTIQWSSPYYHHGETNSCGFSGTGFLYRPDGYMITNGHVVEAANIHDIVSLIKLGKKFLAECATDEVKIGSDWSEGEKNLFLDSINLDGTPQITVFLSNGASYHGELKRAAPPITDGGKDVAIVKIDGQNLPTVPLGKSSEVNVGDPITVIGYPGAANVETDKASALVATVTNGKISALKTDFKGTPVLQSEANINHGNSGGPAFDDQGRVIGIATYGSQEAGGYNFFVPIDTAMEFVHSEGALPESGTFDATWNAALDAYEARHWNKAHQLLNDSLEMMPNQPDIARLLKQASANAATEGPAASFLESVETLNPLLLGAVALITIAGLGGWFFTRRAEKAAAAAASATPAKSQAAAPAQAAGARTIVEQPGYGSLTIANGPTRGQRYTIPRDGLRIGRDPQANTVVLPVDTVGREHAWVMPMEDGQVAVIDRGSSNGTYINSVDTPRIRKVMLKSGDRIFICHENPIEIRYQRS